MKYMTALLLVLTGCARHCQNIYRADLLDMHVLTLNHELQVVEVKRFGHCPAGFFRQKSGDRYYCVHSVICIDEVK